MVIGVGNLLLKDEGVGIHVVQALQEINLPQDVKIIDGGTAPDLIAYTEAGDKLIIIDAAKAGGKPGTVYCFQPQDLATENGNFVSVHELGVVQNLKLMALMGNEPKEIVVIGVEPKEIGWGIELSPELQRVIPKIVKVVLKQIDMEQRSTPE
ncbi:MAG: HyaD/HybD family hydrogenase maturation endopeptidase [Dehalococcoidales bacterium]|nr:HyaD/HybD family hydrogenase maturation endopeptidase [Dehalococcoidales bacterium]